MYEQLKVVQKGKYIYTKTDSDIDSTPLLQIHGAIGLKRGLIGFPHNSETYLELKKLGFNDVPHPMDNSEIWVPEGSFKPFTYQLETAKHAVGNYNTWILNSMGSGKTASAIWASEFLRATKEAYKILIVCPLSTVDHVWVREIFTLYPMRSIGIVTGTKKQKLNILRRDYDYYVINHDGIRQEYILEELKKICPDVVVLDEATAMKNYSSNRFKSLKDLVDACQPRLWAVTATPAPNGPEDIYALQTLIDPTTVPSSMNSWKSTTMWKVDKFKWVPKPGHEKIVEAAMQPAIRFLRDDIPKIGEPVEYEVPLTKEQQQAFSDIKNEMVAEVRGEGRDHTILAVNAAVKISKLLQICSGNVYDIDRDTVVLENKDRLNTVVDILQEGGVRKDTKAIIFVPFKSSQLQLYNHLNENGYHAALVNGDTKKSERASIFNDFQSRDKPRVLVAHPKVTSHGLTLTAASIAIWYGPHFFLELYEQGNGRIARIGQDQDLTLVHVGSHKLEWDVYNILKRKGDAQKAVLEMYDKIINSENI